MLALAPAARAGAGDDAHAVALTPLSAVKSGDAFLAFPGCPAGERAIGGGVGFVPSQGPAASVSISQSRPSGIAEADGRPTSWVSEIVNASGAPQSFTAFAICSASSDAVVRTTKFTTKFDGGSLVPCGPGERAIGGGVEPVTALWTDGVRVQVSGPVDETGQAVSTEDGDVPTSWYVSARHHTGKAQTLTAFAVCSKASQATVQATSFTVEQAQAGQATALCPPGQRALSGGLGTTGDRLGWISFSGPTDANGTPLGAAGGVAGGWTAEVGNLTGHRETYKVFVVCEGPTPAPPPGPAPGTPAPTPPAQPGAGGGQGADAIVEADGVSVKAARSLIGVRLVRLELEVDEPLSATLSLVRKGKTLASRRFATVRPGTRVLTLVVPARVKAGRAGVRYELEDAAGNALSARRSVKIPQLRT